MYMKDWLHLSGKGAAVFADGLTVAVRAGSNYVIVIVIDYSKIV